MKSNDLAHKPLAKLVEEFVASVAEAEDLFMTISMRKINRIVDLYRAIGDEILSRGDAGKSAMVMLMSHENTSVRGEAASRCLLGNIDRDHAINVLADICDLREGNVSMNAAHALMVAGEFDMETGPIRRPA